MARDKTKPSETGRGGPALEEADWDDIAGGVDPRGVPENGDFRYSDETDGELPEEDDDNPYQDSDAALPNERAERALRRDPSKERPRFDEV